MIPSAHSQTSREKLAVGFLWHLHQPDYRHASTGASVLPWVRLHACYGYNDMLGMALDHPQSSHMLNFTPVLLDQLAEIQSGNFEDVYLNLSIAPPKQLSAAQRRFILDNFFQANPPTQILPYRRYRELYLRQSRLRRHNGNGDLVNQFSDRDIRDLQVWFNLCWMGRRAQSLQPAKRLIAKGNDFSEADKQALIALQLEIVNEVLEKLKRVSGDTASELTFTPFYHPIAPLLCDTLAARAAMPHASMPKKRYQRPVDLEWHVQEGRRLFEKVAGVKPVGMWPAEGSVSDEAVGVFSKASVKWLVTDDENCLRSIPGVSDRLDAYRPHRLSANPAGPTLFFRNRELSDAIGFRYQMLTGRAAAEDLVAKLEELQARMAHPEQQMVVLALDGENPWNYYPDGGEEFLRQVNILLAESALLQLTTITQFLETSPPMRILDKLHSGSWINADFHIWIGDPVKNRAWDMLSDARAASQRTAGDDPLPATAEHHLHVAEGSDWFWWFGEPNHSPADPVFDELFRLRLQEVYRQCKLPVPHDILESVTGGITQPSTEPGRFLKPNLDGRLSSYYDWLGAAAIDRSAEFVKPALKTHIQKIYFGNDMEQFFLRVDFNEAAQNVAEAGLNLALKVEEPEDCEYILLGGQAGASEGIRTGVGAILECAIPLTMLRVKAGEVIAFHLVLSGEDGLERFPSGRDARGRLFDHKRAEHDWIM